MKVKFIGDNDPLSLLNGKVYTVESFEGGLYRIIDETNEDYLYSPEFFEIVEGSTEDVPHEYPEKLKSAYFEKYGIVD